MAKKKPEKVEAVITVAHARKLIAFAQVQAEERTRREVLDAVLPIIGKEWSGNAVVEAVKKTEVVHAPTDTVLKVFDNPEETE